MIVAVLIQKAHSGIIFYHILSIAALCKMKFLDDLRLSEQTRKANTRLSKHRPTRLDAIHPGQLTNEPNVTSYTHVFTEVCELLLLVYDLQNQPPKPV